MAIITEEPEPTDPPPPPPPPNKTTRKNPTPKSTPPTPNPFIFWFYFTFTVSLISLLFVSLSSLSPQDPKTWFLNLPTSLRTHYSNGRTIKVQTTPNQSPIEIFAFQSGPIRSDSVLIVHGLGCSSFTFRQIVKSLASKGLHAVAIDLPGSGFSDKSTVVIEEVLGGVLDRFLGIYKDIREKGLFWGFDQLVEKGYVNFEENEIRVLKREVVKAIELGSEEMGRVLGQVIDSMGLAPVDLVLHDSAFGLGAKWVSENPRFVRSITLLDTTSSNTALPLWVLEVPVIREFVLGFGFVFKGVLGKHCSKSVDQSDAEANRVLLKGRDGRRSVVEMGKKLNCSFDLEEWGGLDGVKELPIQVIWSDGWSDEWSDEGRRVANALPMAPFVTHSGGRWPQEDTSEEVAETIHQFISSLPKSVKQAEEEPIPENIQKIFDEPHNADHHHHHGHDHGHGGHGHDDASFMDAYGLGHGWGS